MAVKNRDWLRGHDKKLLEYLDMVEDMLGGEAEDFRSKPGPADALVRLNGIAFMADAKTRSEENKRSPNVSVNKGVWNSYREQIALVGLPLLIITDDGLCASYENLDRPDVLGSPPGAEYWLIHHKDLTHPWRYSVDALSRRSSEDEELVS